MEIKRFNGDEKSLLLILDRFLFHPKELLYMNFIYYIYECDTSYYPTMS